MPEYFMEQLSGDYEAGSLILFEKALLGQAGQDGV